MKIRHLILCGFVSTGICATGVSGVRDGSDSAASVQKLSGELLHDFSETLGVTKGDLDKAVKAVKAEGKELRTEGARVLGEIGEEGRMISKGGLDEINNAQADMIGAGLEMRRAAEAVKEEASIVLSDLAGDTKGLLKEASDEARSSWEREGLFGMVAGALGCTSAELTDVIQYFGKEAQAVFRDISALPEWREFLNKTSEAAIGTGEFLKTSSEKSSRPVIQQNYAAPKGGRSEHRENESGAEADNEEGGAGAGAEEGGGSGDLGS